MSDRRYAAFHFGFDFRHQTDLEPVVPGQLIATNGVYIDSGTAPSYQLSDSFIMLAVILLPNLTVRDYYPEVITHIGPSVLAFITGDHDALVMAPGLLSCADVREPRFKLPKPIAIPSRQSFRVEWRIEDNDAPPPVMFTWSFEGLLTNGGVMA